MRRGVLVSGARSQEDAAPFFNPGEMKSKTCVDRKISGMFHRVPPTDTFRGVFSGFALKENLCCEHNVALYKIKPSLSSKCPHLSLRTSVCSASFDPGFWGLLKMETSARGFYFFSTQATAFCLGLLYSYGDVPVDHCPSFYQVSAVDYCCHCEELHPGPCASV